jgi:CubicO group peptidase (beta-lactamase class C family)
MRLSDSILVAIALAVAIGCAWALAWLRQVILVGAAYKAKVLATLIFGSKRSVDPLRADDVSADTYQLMRLFRAHVDDQAHTVTVAFLGFRPRRVAIHRPGLGATLTSRTEPGTLTVAQPPAAAPVSRSSDDPAASMVWTSAGGSPSLDAVVARAFSEPNPRRRRRTRAVVVVKDGRIVAEQYAAGFTEATPFPGWSMTKSVFGALIGVLVGEGRLSLGDRALLPHWRDGDPRGAITVEDLLRMRSGLAFSEVYSDFSSDVIRMLFLETDSAAYAASRPLSAPPGTVWSYASGTTNILSKVARQILGDSEYPHWPRRVLFQPLGMDSAVMEPDAAGTFVGSSFMLATARDWARFGQLYLQDGVWQGRRILPKGWVAFSTRPTPQSPGGRYGAHWWLKLQPEMGGDTPAAARIPDDAYFAVGHEGQTLTVVPSRGLVIVRLGLSIYIDAWNQAAFVADVLDAT